MGLGLGSGELLILEELESLFEKVESFGGELEPNSHFVDNGRFFFFL